LGEAGHTGGTFAADGVLEDAAIDTVCGIVTVRAADPRESGGLEEHGGESEAGAEFFHGYIV
jgi:hypothetical protein